MTVPYSRQEAEAGGLSKGERTLEGRGGDEREEERKLGGDKGPRVARLLEHEQDEEDGRDAPGEEGGLRRP